MEGLCSVNHFGIQDNNLSSNTNEKKDDVQLKGLFSFCQR